MKVVFIVLIIACSAVFVCLSICTPDILAKNSFLEHFIGADLLNIMAVIMTIAIATIASIHIWFNELEKGSPRASA